MIDAIHAQSPTGWN